MKAKVVLIVALWLTVSFVVFFLGYLQAEVMNGVRAYVRGEGLWAKAQKNAVFHLHDYIEHGTPHNLEAFNNALVVPKGDRQAREALQSSPPDINRAYAGFMAGDNDPDDIDSLINFFRYFQHVSYMQQAIVIWTDGDAIIEQIEQLATEAQYFHRTGQGDMLQLLRRLEQLDHEVSRLETEFSNVLSDGARWVKQVTLMGTGTVLLILVIGVILIARRAIVDLDRTEGQLRFSENRFLSMYRSGMLGIMDWDCDGRILDANEVLLQMLGYSRDDLHENRLNWRQLTPPDQYERDSQAIQQVLDQGFCEPYEKDFINRAGRKVPVLIGCAFLEGSHDHGIAFVLDRTSQKQVEDQLRLSATVLEGCRDGILVIDNNSIVLSLNKAYCDMTGFSAEQVRGSYAQFFAPDLAEDTKLKIKQALLINRHWEGDTEIRIAGNDRLPVRLTVSAVHDAKNELQHFVAVFTDIRDRKAKELVLENLAHHDALTGLANRSLFEDRLGQAIARARRLTNQCAVLFLDLDKFKPVNDKYGHHVGDELLLQVADRLRALTRENDSIVRLGGDEFVLILDDFVSREGVAEVAEKLIQGLSAPYHISVGQIAISCSIGISLYPEDGDNTKALTRAADSAMYRAKAAKGGRYQFFDAA